MKIKIRSSVSTVFLENNIVEFFLTNTREQVRIRLQNLDFRSILYSLDGTLTTKEIIDKHQIEDKKGFEKLIKFLLKKGVLSTIENFNYKEDLKSFNRVINFLEDFVQSENDLNKFWENIKKSRFLIIGLGAVGTWVAISLLQSGVRNFVLMDDDSVEITNLHRQIGFTEADVGRKKTVTVSTRLKEMCQDINIKCINKPLNEKSLFEMKDINFDLVVNCADKPTVDITSMWVGEFCMKYKIPHIIGGGYNLHLSLIGATVIPNETACVKCISNQLEQKNSLVDCNIKKLESVNRKVGSFGPMTAIVASIIGMEAVKVLSKAVSPVNINRRGEFNIQSLQMSFENFVKDNECEWCGKNGKYND